MIDDIRRIFREKLIKRVFGEDWRPSDPLANIGADLEILIKGRARDANDYYKRAGYIAGLFEAEEIMREALHEASTDPQKRGSGHAS